MKNDIDSFLSADYFQQIASQIDNIFNPIRSSLKNIYPDMLPLINELPNKLNSMVSSEIKFLNFDALFKSELDILKSFSFTMTDELQKCLKFNIYDDLLNISKRTQSVSSFINIPDETIKNIDVAMDSVNENINTDSSPIEIPKSNQWSIPVVIQTIISLICLVLTYQSNRGNDETNAQLLSNQEKLISIEEKQNDYIHSLNDTINQLYSLLEASEENCSSETSTPAPSVPSETSSTVAPTPPAETDTCQTEICIPELNE